MMSKKKLMTFFIASTLIYHANANTRAPVPNAQTVPSQLTRDDITAIDVAIPPHQKCSREAGDVPWDRLASFNNRILQNPALGHELEDRILKRITPCLEGFNPLFKNNFKNSCEKFSINNGIPVTPIMIMPCSRAGIKWRGIQSPGDWIQHARANLQPSHNQGAFPTAQTFANPVMGIPISQQSQFGQQGQFTQQPQFAQQNQFPRQQQPVQPFGLGNRLELPAQQEGLATNRSIPQCQFSEDQKAILQETERQLSQIESMYAAVIEFSQKNQELVGQLKAAFKNQAVGG